MRRFLAAALAASVVIMAAPVAGARGAMNKIVLSGDGSAYVDVRLRQAVELDCCRMVEAYRNGLAYFRVSGFSAEIGGTYAGFAIERPSDGRIMKALVRIPPMDLEDGRIPTFISLGRATRLPAGEYRIHLISDGPSTVHLTARGLPSDLQLKPTRPSDTSAELVTLATDTGPQALQARVPVEVAKGSTVALAVKTEGEFAQAHYLAQCLVEPGGQCSEEEDYDTWISPASGGGGGSEIDVFGRGLAPGSYEAVFTAGSVGVPQGAYGFVLVLS